MIAETLIVQIRAEVDKAVRDMKRAETQGDKSAMSFRKMAAAMGVGNIASQAFSRGIAAVTQLISESAQAASDAEETISKFSVVFRDVESAPSIMYDLAESFNLADSTAARLLGNTGDLLTGFGLTQDAALELSDATTRLAIDLASFTNAQGGAEAVSKALTAAYAGERESLKTYGIVMTEADVQARTLANEMQGLTFESDRQARAFATLQLAQEQSANAIGDYERTAESTANTQRELNETLLEFKENLGDSINEGVTPLRRALIDLFDGINTQAGGQTLFDQLVGSDASDRSLEQIERAKRLIEETIELEARRGGPAADRQISILYEQLEVLDDMAKTESARAEAMEYANGLIERGARVREEAAAAAEREAAAAERIAQMNAVAWEERLSIAEEYTQKLEDLEADSLEQIELDRQRALDRAAESYVRTGAEIELINQFYDAQRERELQAASDRQLQIRKNMLEQTRAAFQQASDERLQDLEARIEAEEAMQERIREADTRTAQVRQDNALSTTSFILAASEDIARGLFKNELAAAIFNRASASFNAFVNTAEAVTKALTLGPIAGPAAATAVGVLGGAQIAAINSQPLPKFEQGGSFITSGPQAIMVGDGQSPRERVTVEPLSGPYRSGGGNITVNVHAVAGSDKETVAKWVVEGIKRGQQRGTIGAVA